MKVWYEVEFNSKNLDGSMTDWYQEYPRLKFDSKAKAKKGRQQLPGRTYRIVKVTETREVVE